MAKHLHVQAGGNPSQGPKGEMANPRPSVGTGNDFPDAPEANIEAADHDRSENEGGDNEGGDNEASENEPDNSSE